MVARTRSRPKLSTAGAGTGETSLASDVLDEGDATMPTAVSSLGDAQDDGAEDSLLFETRSGKRFPARAPTPEPPTASSRRHSPRKVREAGGRRDEEKGREEQREGQDDAEESDSSGTSSSTLRMLLAKARAKYEEAEEDEEEDVAPAAFEDEDIIRLGDDSDDEDPGDEGMRAKARTAKASHSRVARALSMPLILPPLPPLTSHHARKLAAKSTADSIPPPLPRGRDRFGLPPPRPPLKPFERKLLRTTPAHLLPSSLRPLAASRALPHHELPLTDSRDAMIKREIQALRLHNSLDPKRFYRGQNEGSKAKDKVPERMLFGHIIESGMGAKVSKKGPHKEGGVRKRSFMEALIADETAKAYAKKKFVGEVQRRAASGGKLFYKQLQKKRKSRR